MRRIDLDFYKLRLIFNHSLSRSLVVKILLVAVAFAVAALPFLASLREVDPPDGCDGVYAPFAASIPLPDLDAVLLDLDAVLLDLMAGKWLSLGDRPLCIGRGSGRVAAAAMRRLGLLSAIGVEEGCGRLPFRESSFDFVFATRLDRAVAPARVVLEMERVLRPGRAGAVMAGPARFGSVVRAVAPVAALVRFSDVVAVREVNGSTPAAAVVFRKRGRVRKVE